MNALTIDMPFRVDLSSITTEDAKDAAWQHYRDTLSAISAAELRKINNRPQPVPLSAESADRFCPLCINEASTAAPCPACANTGVDTATLHPAAQQEQAA